MTIYEFLPILPTTGRFGPLGQQIHLDDRRDVRIERDPAFPLPLADHGEPAAADVDIDNIESQHLRRAETAVRTSGARTSPFICGFGRTFPPIARDLHPLSMTSPAWDNNLLPRHV